MTDRSWTARAACHIDIAYLFDDPEPGTNVKDAGYRKQIRDAQKVCAVCPVRQECLDEALTEEYQYTIRGGMTGWQRKALLRKRRREA